MATKKDLVEAYAFSRRRLVTAFVSGAPGGREVEPSRPGRTIIGGLALSVLLVAGAAIAGVFAPRTAEDWTTPGNLIISKEKGAAYVILATDDGVPVLRPVINITSAQLILGPDLEPKIVSQQDIDGQQVGDDIGILGAPATVPTSSLLIKTGWTACTDDGFGIRVELADEPLVRTVGGGFVVETDDGVFVVAESRQVGSETPRAYSYRVSESGRDQDNMLDALNLPVQQDAKRVPADWLKLFPAGGELGFDSFGLSGFGQVAPYATELPDLPDDARIGDYYTVAGGALVLTADGPAQFDAFAMAVYLNSSTPGGEPRDLELDEAPSMDQALPPYAQSHWPGGLLEEVPGEQCAQLTPVAGEVPVVGLATDPGPEASAVAAQLAPQWKTIGVTPGRGAYVLSGGWDDTVTGAPYIVDAKGSSYALLGSDAATQLGYGDYEVRVVPDPWIELFDTGVVLSRDAALCPPGRIGVVPCA